jgi:hypothetical protein
MRSFGALVAWIENSREAAGGARMIRNLGFV